MTKTPLPWPPRGLNRVQAAAYVGVSAGTFDKLVDDGRMPRPIHVGSRRIYDRHAIDLAFVGKAAPIVCACGALAVNIV